MRRGRRAGLSPAGVALVVLAVTAAATYLAFTRELPFRSHFEIDAVVMTANQLKPGSLVRIAGVNVGKVTQVEPIGGEQAARVTMRLSDSARPIHKDANLRIRPRILFEGNFFVDLSPGSPSAPELGEGETIPITQTAGPVQLDQVLGALRADTRKDLKRVLRELGRGLSGGGADAVNRTIPLWEPAYRNSAIVNDATLGVFEHDLSGYIDGAGRVAAGLDRNGRQLQSLITDLRRTAGAFAVRDRQLSDAIEELPRLLRAGRPALGALNEALPSLRRFTRDLRPGVRSAGPSLDAQVPFVRELRGLVQPSEARGLAADLEAAVPALARLTEATIPLLEHVRAASSCQNEVILPWTKDTVPDPDFPAIGPVFQEQVKPLVGLAGESRTFDANGQWFRVSLNAAQYATPFGGERFLLTDNPILGVNPPPPAKRSPLRPDVPCETQQRPDLRTRQAQPPRSFRVADPPPAAEARAREEAVGWLRDALRDTGQADQRVVDELLDRAELGKLGTSLPAKPRSRTR